MTKKRKTRQEKIIIQLRRQLNTKFTPRQEAITKPIEAKAEAKEILKKPDASILSYNQTFIRQDLLKTLILSLAIISLELVLYLKLR